MANIRQLNEESGLVFYPQTHEKAVIDSDGNTLDTKIAGTLKYTEQSLTAAQQTQARTNIGALGEADILDPLMTYTHEGDIDPLVDPSAFATEEELNQLSQKLSIPITIDNEVPDYPYASYDQNSMVCDKQQNIPVGAVLKKVKCASSGTAAPKSTKIVVFDANNTRVSRTEIGTIGTTDAEFDISALGIVVQSGYKYCVECVAAKWVSGVSNRYVRITGGAEGAYNDYYFGFAFVAEGSADKLAAIEDDIEELQETKPTAAASVNLYDYESRLDGYFFNSNGYTAAAGYALTQPIKVTSGVTYKTEHSAFMRSVRKCARCDESGAYISGLDMTDDNGYDTVTPNFDGYIRFNVGDTNAKSFMVCESSKYPDHFVPFGRILTDTLVDVRDVFGGVDNPLYRKIIACDGDSICYGAGYRNGYAKIIAERNQMAFQNLALPGATLTTETYDGSSPRHWISTNVSNLRADADYIILEGGVNDPSDKIGTLSPSDFVGPFDSTTLYGAIDTLCKSLYARFPGKKVGFIIVHATYSSWMPGAPKYEAVVAGLKKWGIPVCDLMEGCPPLGLLPSDDYLRVTYTTDGDGWHLNEAGYRKYYCDKIEAWLRTL